MRKDIRKILKRKDSDAGQKGTYLLLLMQCNFWYPFASFLKGVLSFVDLIRNEAFGVMNIVNNAIFV